MGVRHYAAGEHPAGFIGFRVTRLFDEVYRQEYFSTRAAATQDDSDPYYRYQHLRAKYRDTQWEVESLWYQYQVFVTQNNPRSKPYRGVGVHGISIAFARWNETYLEACFSINRKRRAYRPGATRFFLRNHSFSDGWALAVNTWADEYEILDVDRERVLANPPSPQQFKLLRQHMNEAEGFNIPVKALRPVFLEQRNELQNKRLQLQATELKLNGLGPKDDTKSVEADMLEWFNRNKQESDHSKHSTK